MENFEKIAAPTLKELFVNRMAGLILSGKLGVGEKFPPERALAEQMGIGKTAVHNGLQELARIGLVTIKPQSGVYVADYMADGNLETFNAIMKFNGDHLSVDTIAGVFDLRLAVEGFAMRRLAENHTLGHISALRDEIVEIGRYAASGEFTFSGLASKMYGFHKKLCRMSGCFMLALCFKAVEDGSVCLEERYIRSVGVASAINLLELFVNRIEAGDGDGAWLLMENGLKAQLERYKMQLNS